MIVEKFRLNIDLPDNPKGTIVFHEYEHLPSQFGKDRVYATEGIWYTGVSWGTKIRVWKWISGLIETCISMADFDPTAKKMVTKL